MPIVPNDPNLNVTVTQEPNRFVKPERVAHQISTHLDYDTPFIGLTADLDGFRWSVNYFNQVKAESDLVSPLDNSLPDALSGYNRITNMLLFVDDDLANTTNPTGSAKVTGITPQQGDIFVTEISGNRKALLKVDEVNKLNYNLNPVYVINYSLDSYIDKDATRYQDLLTKVVNEFVYDRHFNTNSSMPIIKQKQFDTKVKLSEMLDVLSMEFVRSSIGKRGYLQLPGTTDLDPYLERFFLALVDSHTNPYISEIQRSGVTIDFELSPYQALLNQNLNMFRYSPRTRTFKDISQGTPIRHGGPYGIKRVCELVDGSLNAFQGILKGDIEVQVYNALNTPPLPTVDTSSEDYVEPTGYIQMVSIACGITVPVYLTFSPSTPLYSNEIVDDTIPDPEPVTPPPTKEYTVNDDGTISVVTTYADGTVVNSTLPAGTIYQDAIPSTHVYLLPTNLAEADSIIELLILQYLREEELIIEHLMYVIEDHYNWTPLDKFYYIPLLILLIKYYNSCTYAPDTLTL